jgi:hypothetical protein
VSTAWSSRYDRRTCGAAFTLSSRPAHRATLGEIPAQLDTCGTLQPAPRGRPTPVQPPTTAAMHY